MKSAFWAALSVLSWGVLAVLANDQHQQLVRLAAAGSGIIKLDENTFNLLTAPKRTWSTTIQLTALDKRRKCIPCGEFDPTWRAVSQAWTAVPADTRNDHFFATIDFDEAPSVFQKLGLSSAPVVYHYPATEGPRKPASGRTGAIKYDFSDGFDAGPLVEHLNRHTPVPIPFKEPTDWAKVATSVVAVVGALLILRFLAPIVQSRWSWAVGTVLVILVMSSGYMFTRIRNSPYAGRDGGWIAAGYQNQYGQEVQVISFIYGLLSFAFLMLILAVPHQTSAYRQRMQVYLWTGVTLIIYSVLVSLFRLKNRGYPFKLFL